MCLLYRTKPSVTDETTVINNGSMFIEAYKQAAKSTVPIIWQDTVPVDAQICLFYAGLDYDFIEQLLGGLLVSAISIVFERGDAEDTKSLMSWRYDFLVRSGSFKTLGPCGSEFGSHLPATCMNCVPVRREGFSLTSLARALREEVQVLLREEAQMLLQQPSLIDKELLWSYVILQGGQDNYQEPALSPQKIFNEQALEEITLRYIGVRDYNFMSIDPLPDDSEHDYFINVCPGYVQDAQKLVIRRSSGDFFPNLTFGDLFRVSNVSVRKGKNSSTFGLLLSEETEITQGGSLLSRDFLPEYTEQTRQAVNHIGHRLFGFEHMKPFQHEVISHAATGRSILGISATGSGKSECFILSAFLLSGVTIVISPLKSLMQDQYEERLQKKYGLGDLVTVINGDVKFKERQRRLKRMELGEYKLLYFTPEQLERSYVLESLRRTDENVGIRFIALDEAHCISQWGHDFRSSYLNMIKRLRRYNINPVRIALTATASPKVREDLCAELDLNPEEDVLIVSSNRQELNLIVRTCESGMCQGFETTSGKTLGKIRS